MTTLRGEIANWAARDDGQPFIQPTEAERLRELVAEAVAATNYSPELGSYSMRMVPARAFWDLGVDLNSYNRPPLGHSFTEIPQPEPPRNGEVLQNLSCLRCNRTGLCVQRPSEQVLRGRINAFPRDYPVAICTSCLGVEITPAQSDVMAQTPPTSRGSFWDRIMEARRRLSHSWAPSNSTATGVMMERHRQLSEEFREAVERATVRADEEIAAAVAQAPASPTDDRMSSTVRRPDHYRVTHRRCICGFRAAPEDVRRHVQGHINPLSPPPLTPPIGSSPEVGGAVLTPEVLDQAREALRRPEIGRMPCGCNQSSCERCGPWLRPYASLPPLETPPSVDETALTAGDALARAIIGERPGVMQGHYRLPEGGKCVCGFESIFTGDMDRHIAEGNTPHTDVVMAQDGQEVGRITNLDVTFPLDAEPPF